MKNLISDIVSSSLHRMGEQRTIVKAGARPKVQSHQIVGEGGRERESKGQRLGSGRR